MPDMLVRLYAMPDHSPRRDELKSEGFLCRRAESYERSVVLDFVREHWPHWVDEATLGFSFAPPKVHICVRGRDVIGFACYDVARPNLFGPTGVDERFRGKGIGRVLLWRSLRSMAASGFAYGIIGGVDGRKSFYEEAVGATVIEGSVPGIYVNHIGVRDER